MRRFHRSRTLPARPSKLSVEALERRGMMAADAGLVMSVEEGGPANAEQEVSSIDTSFGGYEFAWADFVVFLDGPDGSGGASGMDQGMDPGMEFVVFACDEDDAFTVFSIAEAAAASDVDPTGMSLLEPMLEPLAASMAVDLEPLAAAPATRTVLRLDAWASFAVESAVTESPAIKRGLKSPRRG